MLLVSAPFFVAVTPSVASAASSGDITISEFMADSATIADADGEWIELHNNTGAAIDLSGWSIDDGGSAHTFGSLIIAPGTAAVICRNSSTASNGGVVCSDSWAGMSLSNSGDTITVYDDLANTIDTVTYTSGDVTTGHANTVVSGTIGSESSARYHADNFGTPYGTALLDETPPVISNLRPADGRHVRGIFETRAWASDPDSAISDVSLSVTGPVNSGPHAMVFDGTQNRWEYPLDTNALGLTDGVYDFTFTATNGDGLQTTRTVNNITIDNTRPLATLTTPVHGSSTSGVVAISGTASDAHLVRWRLRIRDTSTNTNILSYVSTDTSNITYNWNSAGYNGNYAIILTAYDTAGNSSTTVTGVNRAVINVANDVIAPTMQVVDPEPGEALHRHEEVFIRANDASGISSVEMQFSGNPAWFPVSFRPDTKYPDRYFQKIPDAISDGVYDITFRATDTAGNQTTQTIPGVIVDKTNPVLNVTNPGTNLSGSVPIVGDISDNMQIGHYRVQIMSGALPPHFAKTDLIYNQLFTVNATTFSGVLDTIDTTAFADGTYHLRIVTMDEAGNNVDERYVSITIDNSTTPSPVITPGSGGSTGSGDAQPTITFAAAPAGLAGGGIGFVGGANLGAGNVLGANTDNANAQTQTTGSTSSTSTTGGTAGRVKATSDTKRSWVSYWYYWLPALLALIGLLLLLAKRRRDKDGQNTTA